MFAILSRRRALWRETVSFFAECDCITHQKYGFKLRLDHNRRANPQVAAQDWVAAQMFDLMTSVLTSGGVTDLERLDKRRQRILVLITLACRGSDAKFRAALTKDDCGMAEHLVAIRTEWANARTAPPPRIRVNENMEQALCRMTPQGPVSDVYAEGRTALISGSFADNNSPAFLLAYAVQRRRTMRADIACNWRLAPRFAALSVEEAKAVDLMVQVMRSGDHVLDLMVMMDEEPPNGGAVMEWIKSFQVAAAMMLGEADVTPDLPTGAPGNAFVALAVPLDAALGLLDAAATFYADPRN